MCRGTQGRVFLLFSMGVDAGDTERSCSPRGAGPHACLQPGMPIGCGNAEARWRGRDSAGGAWPSGAAHRSEWRHKVRVEIGFGYWVPVVALTQSAVGYPPRGPCSSYSALKPKSLQETHTADTYSRHIQWAPAAGEGIPSGVGRDRAPPFHWVAVGCEPSALQHPLQQEQWR